MKMRSGLSKSNLRLLIVAHAIWLALIFVLSAWWGKLLLRQAGQIRDLEIAAGYSLNDAAAHWGRTQHMIFWESSSFFALIVLSAGFIFWLYWRDMKRARGLQAFFASVTHELRTPLTSIRLQAESIADSFSESSPERGLVGRLMEDTLRLESQVERTLELARVEGGGDVFVQALELKPWLERMVQSWREAYASRLEIVTAQVEDVTIEADPSCLQTILKNLFENTLKHSKRDRARVDLSASVEGANVRLVYQDNGSALDADPQRLGQLFYRGSSSQGTGVGLYLVQTLMRKMKGSASFSKVSGSGFRVVLAFLKEVSSG